MRGLETSVILLIATVAFMWAVLGHSTADEIARMHDATGESTRIAWR